MIILLNVPEIPFSSIPCCITIIEPILTKDMNVKRYTKEREFMEREFYYSKDGTKVMVIAPIGDLEPITDIMNRHKYQYDNLLVIGNGFDLNLGLPTSYRNFVESHIFNKMYEKRIQEKRDNEERNQVKMKPSLIDFLYGKKFYERWYDIEQALLEYISKRPDGSFVNNVEEDKRDYVFVCESLVEYLASLFNTGNDLEQSKMMEKSSAGRLLQRMSSERNIVYSFNYTPIYLIINAIYGNASLETIRVHGKIEDKTIFKGNLKDNAIILGVETNDMNDIAPGYSFLLKSNNLAYRSSNIAIDLLNTRNVIFFGHSLNQMDFGYFEEYFKFLSSNADKERSLIIITKNESSRLSLLDNLRKMGISVRDIFAHTTVKIIHTDNLTSEKSEDSILFNELLTIVEKAYL